MNFFSKRHNESIRSKRNSTMDRIWPCDFSSGESTEKLGILKVIEESHHDGLTLEEVAEKVKQSNYGVRVLLESGLSMGLVIINDHKYTLTKTGYFILHDALTKVNMDFVNDICYKGLFHLEESIVTGKAAGMKELGEWPTIYEGVSKLPEQLQRSWFHFDHFFFR